MNIAINGFGRIGRAAFKALLVKKNLNVVAINDLTDTKTLAHLLAFDSCYGRYGKKVSSTADSIIVDNKKYSVMAEKEPARLPWKKLKVDLVLECTGRFTKKEEAELHLVAGAKKVIISAPASVKTSADAKALADKSAGKPAKSEDIKTIVLSVNEKELKKSDQIISMASCTTNCLAPVSEIVRKNFGIKKAIMTTIHSYTADQNLVDGPHKDLRRARAAAVNMIPTTTGAAQAAAKTIPSLKDKFDGLSIRVPTPVVSLCDIVFITEKKANRDEVNEVFKKESLAGFKGFVEVTDEPLVSSDFIGNPASAIVDLSLTKVIDGDLLKVVAWYDNEWGYSCRLADLCEYISRKGLI